MVFVPVMTFSGLLVVFLFILAIFVKISISMALWTEDILG